MGDGRLDALAATVNAWVALDPDPDTREEALGLLTRARAGDAEAESLLHDAFDGRLAFGTAGLRAPIGAGPRRMNRLVIAQSSAGLADFLLDQRDDAKDPPSVVVGYDGRVQSDCFAHEAAEVLAGAGLHVTLLPEPTPTPTLAFAVRHLGADAGVMITASHNPPGDNGYKVYLGGAGGGRQVAPPQDGEIADRIARAAEQQLANGSPLAHSGDYTVAEPALVEAYAGATAEAVRAGISTGVVAGDGPGSGGLPAASADPDPIVVYTAMHGVGSRIARNVFAKLDLPRVIPVPEQDEPDGSFPTLAFPNPEESGALDLAYALAREHGADYVLAHDPDADRLALAARDPDDRATFRRLTGNQLGLLLGWRAAERERRRAERERRAPRGTLANTIVSSPALITVAHAYGLDHVETLTGFKWVSQVPDLIFGFEEALGYLTHPEVVGDKDGISAAAEVLALARELHAAGRSVWDLLDEAAERFGHFASAQVVVRRTRMTEVEAMCAWVRAHPPAGFDGIRITALRDYESDGLAPVRANILAYDLTDGSRVMIRPSGTEPKLKVYLDAFSGIGSAKDRRAATSETLAALEQAVRSYLERADQEARA